MRRVQKKLKEAHKKEEELVLARQKQEQEEQVNRHRGEEARIGVEISKLEDELERLAAPSQMLSSLSCTSNPATTSPIHPVKAELSELEQELQCCACSHVCAPPSLIFQCPEGDLICGACRDSGLKSCPSCRSFFCFFWSNMFSLQARPCWSDQQEQSAWKNCQKIFQKQKVTRNSIIKRIKSTLW